jgi:hypothetical protein
MPAANPTLRPRDAAGVTSVGVVLLLAAAAGAYLAWVWVPVYVVHYQVKQVVRQAANEAARERDDEKVVARMVSRLRALEEQERLAADGRATLKPVVDVRPGDVRWERTDPTSLRVAFEYQRELVLPFLDHRIERVMNVDMVMEVGVHTSGSGR